MESKLYARLLLAAVWIALVPFAGRWIIAGISLALAAIVSRNFLICAALEFLRQRVFAVLSVQKLVSAAAEKAGAAGARLVRRVFRLEPDREGQ